MLSSFVMRKVDLDSFDLNLLISLDILLEECHITRASTRLNVSQPAMSRILARLREAFDDQLLVRDGTGYIRTPRADDLVNPVKDALDHVRSVLAGAEFRPDMERARFRICTLPYGEVVLLPHVMKSLHDAKARAKIDVVQHSLYSVAEIVEGKTDISIGVIPDTIPNSCVREPLFEDTYVCVVGKTHPVVQSGLTLDAYLAYPHSIIDSGANQRNEIQDTLSELGKTRNITKTSPHFLASLFTISQTDLLQVVPLGLVAGIADALDLRIMELPFSAPPLKISQVWHRRNDHSRPHKWLREQIAAAAGKVRESQQPG